MPPPNLLILLSDQHNRRVLGCSGDPVARTPALDRLAAEGLRFERAYCPAPLCVPSRMSFLSSRLPSANRVWTNAHILDSAIPTWPQALGQAGYETTLIGRMHFIGPDQHHGFHEHRLGELETRWERIPRVACGQSGASVRVAGTGNSAYDWYDEQVADSTCAFLEEHAGAPHAAPFAAVAGFLLPHSPYVAPADLFQDYLDRLPHPPSPEPEPPELLRRHIRAHSFDDGITERQARHARAAYYAMCEQLDRRIGRILDRLDATGLAAGTLVVYLSDHGDLLGEHGCWFKSSYYEGSAGVPLIARWPGRIPAGGVCGDLVSLLDLGPTFCAAAGAQMPPGTDGVSLLDRMTGRTAAPARDAVLAELSHDRYSPEVPSRMLRTGDWKLWQALFPDGPQTLLFNLRDDPGELRDLSQAPACAAVRDALLRRLHAGWDPAAVAAESARRGREVVRSIRELGDRWEHGGLALRAPPDLEQDVTLF